MSSKLLLIRLVWTISLLFIFASYIFLSWNVSEEYFLYRTASHIAIKDYPTRNITVPELVVCVILNFTSIVTKLGGKRIGELVTGDYFSDQNDTWKIEN